MRVGIGVESRSLCVGENQSTLVEMGKTCLFYKE
jgi:hypothetical protein